MKSSNILPRFGAVIGVLTSAIFLTAAFAADDAKAPASPITWTAGGKPSDSMDVLYVQNAEKVSLEDGKLVLRGVNPTTVCFTDRPARLAGHLPTTAFIPLWSQGKDSFLKDPPNATLSIFSKDSVSDVVVEISNPVLEGKNLTYDAKVLEGDASVKGGACSLFIDIIGMPRTPISYAGAARRAFRPGGFR